jgi:type VI protein secretion system component Hcp
MVTGRPSTSLWGCLWIPLAVVVIVGALIYFGLRTWPPSGWVRSNADQAPAAAAGAAEAPQGGSGEWPKQIDRNEVYTADADGQILVCDSDAQLKGSATWIQNWNWNGNPDKRGELYVMKNGDKGKCTFTSGTVFPTGTSLDELAEAEMTGGCSDNCSSVAIHESLNGEIEHRDWNKPAAAGAAEAPQGGSGEWPKQIDRNEVYTADADGQILVCDSDAQLKGSATWIQNWNWNGNPDKRGELYVMKNGDKGKCTFTSGTVFPTGTSLDELAEAEMTGGSNSVAIHESLNGEIEHRDWAKK